MPDPAGFMNFHPQLGSWVSEEYACLIRKFEELDGKPIDTENKRKFLQMMYDCGIITSDTDQPSTMTEDQVDRKYASYQTLIPLYGFGRNDGQNFQLTEIGRYFIKTNDIDVFIMNQMLKFQYPNSRIPKPTNRGDGFKIRPLIFFLKLLCKLHENEKVSSLSKIEINLVRMHTSHNDNEVDAAYTEVIQNRENNANDPNIDEDCNNTITRFFPAFGATGLINHNVGNSEKIISMDEQQYRKVKTVLEDLESFNFLDYFDYTSDEDWLNYYGNVNLKIIPTLRQISKLSKFKQILDQSKGQIIFYGPPGTGKTLIAKKLANLLTNSTLNGWSITDYRKLVQFHPSYSYEDFVQGIKPVKLGNDVVYQIRPGIFQKLCMPIFIQSPVSWYAAAVYILNQAGGPLHYKTITSKTLDQGLFISDAEHPEFSQLKEITENIRLNEDDSIFSKTAKGTYELNEESPDFENEIRNLPKGVEDKSSKVLIIDEINRGNLPKIFGELIYALEYREEEIDLQYKEFDEGSQYGTLKVPKYLSVIGTMNTADRSIVLFDTALRRRFSFIPLFPDYDLLAQSFNIDIFFDKGNFEIKLRNSSNKIERHKILSVLVLSKINGKLINDSSIGREKQIGHTFLLDLEKLSENFIKIWKYDIIPLLEEFYFDAPENLNTMFGNEIFTKEDGIKEFSEDQLESSLTNYFQNY